MVELKIVKIGEFDEYTLKQGKQQHLLALGFYDMPKPKVGDVLIFPEEWLDTSSPDHVHSLYFEPFDDSKEGRVKKEDLVGLKSNRKSYILKRIYG